MLTVGSFMTSLLFRSICLRWLWMFIFCVYHFRMSTWYRFVFSIFIWGRFFKLWELSSINNLFKIMGMMIKVSSHHKIMLINMFCSLHSVRQVSFVLVGTDLFIHIDGLINRYKWFTDNKDDCEDYAVLQEWEPQREGKSHKFEILGMHTDVNGLFVNNIETAITQFRMLLRTLSRFSRFGMKVCKFPVRIDLIKTSISQFHRSITRIFNLVQ